ncbi:MAG: serine/threonine protein kinase [Candidatus Riflebacteria bacterium]|nr:serine/threonine protein kinase [Candidatus Riflebacteria bacterium]
MIEFSGKTAGNYTVTHKIGDGGFATVYIGKHNILDKKVAIKFLLEDWIDDNDVVDRFFDEAKTMERLKGHPNIVSILDIASREICQKEGLPPYFIMEFVDGPSLEKKIHSDEGFTLEFIYHVSKCTLSALAHCHKVDESFIHRDIKPSNILTTDDGSVKLTDFGIVKAKANTSKTGEGLTLGSTDYMSPEQALGKRDIDHRSDIYSFGITLYEMVVGKLPFTYDNPNSVALAHIQETPIAPIQVNDAVPKRLNDIIMKAIAKNRDERYQTFEDMLDAINHISDPEPEISVDAKSMDLSKVKSELPEDDLHDKSVPGMLSKGKDAERKAPGSFSSLMLPLGLVALFTALFVGGFFLYQKSILGVLSVKAVPAGTVIMVNDKKIGTSPIELPLEAGAYKLSLSSPNFRTDNLRIDITAKQTLVIERQLIKDAPEAAEKLQKFCTAFLATQSSKKGDLNAWKDVVSILNEFDRDQKIHQDFFKFCKENGLLKKAHDYYKSMADKQKDNVIYPVLYARCLMESKKLKNVIDILTKAWDLDSNSTLLLNALGDYYLIDGKTQKAKQYFELSIFLDSNQDEVKEKLKGL